MGSSTLLGAPAWKRSKLWSRRAGLEKVKAQNSKVKAQGSTLKAQSSRLKLVFSALGRGEILAAFAGQFEQANQLAEIRFIHMAQQFVWAHDP